MKVTVTLDTWKCRANEKNGRDLVVENHPDTNSLAVFLVDEKCFAVSVAQLEAALDAIKVTK